MELCNNPNNLSKHAAIYLLWLKSKKLTPQALSSSSTSPSSIVPLSSVNAYGTPISSTSSYDMLTSGDAENLLLGLPHKPIYYGADDFWKNSKIKKNFDEIDKTSASFSTLNQLL